MSRLLVGLLPLLLCSSVLAQPDLNVPGKGRNPVAQPFIPPPQFQPPKSPEDAATYFLNAVTSPNEFNLTIAVSGARIGFYGSSEWDDTQRDIYPLSGLRQLKVDAIKVANQTDTEATVSVTAHQEFPVQGEAPRRTKPNTYILPVRLEKNVPVAGANGASDIWRVVPLSNEQVVGEPVWKLPPLQLLATFALRDPQLLPYLRQQRAINQMKQLSLGLLQFVQDYDQVFALEDASYQRAIKPYVKQDSLFDVPASKDEHWRFNDNLSGKTSQAITTPARTVLFYDGTAPSPDSVTFRYGDKTPIGFADGSCKLVTKDELQTLVWKP